ncbi:MAG: TIGR03986 family CRISPR-associated RAMP protein [Anaerolineales bacterium]|nr:TIGR03986 family CRISPR-associated RAMP protein [Anaerolineales bacterium]MCB8954074.1 TIGR03986 family CRISPR-associated RAMP protein [Ardenticatenales bacterium]
MAIKHDNPTQSRIDRDRNQIWARAPYNFVPLPARVAPAAAPLDQDRYQGLSGWIECQLETRSPLYIRGMLTESDYKAFGQKGPDELTSEQKEKQSPFFAPGEKNSHGHPLPVIPGSSLRGMIRQLVEIISYGRIRWVGNQPVFTYRAVAASKDDPLRDPYRDIIGALGKNVQAGFLKQEGENWFIEPAQTPQEKGWSTGDSFLKVKERQIGGKDITGLRRFNSPNYEPNWYPVSFEVENKRGARGNYLAVTQIGDRGRYREEGVLVCSGNMLETQTDDNESRSTPRQKAPRRSHVLILLQNRKAERLSIEEQTIKDYLASLTPFQQKLDHWGGKQGCLKDGAPVFYVADGKKVKWFGHSPNFRVPAFLTLPGENRAARPLDFVPSHLRTSEQPDLADAIFGWVEEQDEKGERVGPAEQRAGRVFIGNAHLLPDQKDVWHSKDAIIPHTLSGPKITTFQHYLVQNQRMGHSPDRKENLAHYGTSPSETEIRGYKLYWHKGRQPSIEATAKEQKHEKQLTRIRPISPGVRFTFKIHFDNLREEELGALCWALSLPVTDGHTYCHKLGMGKPLGMGAVSLVPTLNLINRQERYQSLFQGERWKSASSTAEMTAYVEAFEKYVLVDGGIGPQATHLAEMERIKMLLAMLQWREGDAAWLEQTRYMEIERDSGRNKTVDEFKERPVLGDPLQVAGNTTPGIGPSSIESQLPVTKTSRTETPTPKAPSRPAKPVSDTPPSLIHTMITGSVYHIDSKGDVFLEIENSSWHEDVLGWIPNDKLGGIQYQLGHKAACIVLAVDMDRERVECAPAKTYYLTGKVTVFEAPSPSGWIQPDGSHDPIFFHSRDISGKLETLNVGERVQFRLKKGLKGQLEARNIRLMD